MPPSEEPKPETVNAEVVADDKPVLDLATKTDHAGAQAQEQAAEYGGIWDWTTLTLDDGDEIRIPPDPRYRLLDDDQMAAYDALIFESESYERGDEIVVPPQKVYDNNGNVVTELPAQTRPGPLLVPYRKKNDAGVVELISPSWEVRVVKAALGEADYARLRAGTIDGQKGAARHVHQIWAERGTAVKERRARDPKSAGSAVDLETVSEADSQ